LPDCMPCTVTGTTDWWVRNTGRLFLHVPDHGSCSQNAQADAGFLCDQAVLLGEPTEGANCAKHRVC
jgi:hypothetical protein